MTKNYKRRVIRNSDKERSGILKAVYALFRFLVYGMVGVFGEVTLYTIIKIGREIPILRLAFQFDWRVDDRLNLNGIWNSAVVPWFTFFGQCSLWMFGAYALCSLFFLEAIYRKSLHRSWVLRGVYYAFTIMTFEFFSGFVIKWLSGYEIWYYSDRFNILNMTSLLTLPMWFVTGLLVEALYRELMDIETRSKLEKKLDEIEEKMKKGVQ